jgi:hypothetical protein
VSGNFHAFSSPAPDTRTGDPVLQFILFDALSMPIGQAGDRIGAIGSIAAITPSLSDYIDDLGRTR